MADRQTNRARAINHSITAVFNRHVRSSFIQNPYILDADSTLNTTIPKNTGFMPDCGAKFV
jgi:hypothetical protein